MSKFVKIVAKSDRYLMPQMQIRGEGRGNGVKTVIDNMAELAKSLHRDPEHLTRYFGLELGAMSRYDSKTGFATVNGTHSIQSLNENLQQFISRFVLCPKCGLPETTINVPKPGERGPATVDCASCGYHQPLDMTHRLAQIIVRGHDQTQEGRRKRVAGINPVKRITGRLRTIDSEIEGDGLEGEAALQRRVEGLKEFFNILIQDGMLQMGEDIAALVAAICGPDVLERWAYVSPILRAFVNEDRFKQMYLLYSMELLALRYPVVQTKLQDILFNLYSSHIVSEAVFFDWASVSAESFVPNDRHDTNLHQVDQFIQWLRQNDEEDDEDEEEGEEGEEYEELDEEDEELEDDDEGIEDRDVGGADDLFGDDDDGEDNPKAATKEQ